MEVNEIGATFWLKAIPCKNQVYIALLLFRAVRYEQKRN